MLLHLFCTEGIIKQLFVYSTILSHNLQERSSRLMSASAYDYNISQYIKTIPVWPRFYWRKQFR